jgi:hypothetical protein
MDPINSEHDLNQWLESALGQYSKAEPRPGLENRILASLQTERSRITARRRWWWAAGAAVAAATIVLAVWLGHGDHTRTPDAIGVSAEITVGDGDRLATPRDVRPATQPAELAAVKARRQPSTDPAAGAHQVGDVAKLDQFPTPTPLSDQEKLLARYVEQFPQRAALIARAQTDLQESNQREMAAPWPQNTNVNSQEQQQ